MAVVVIFVLVGSGAFFAQSIQDAFAGWFQDPGPAPATQAARLRFTAGTPAAPAVRSRR